MSSLQLPVDLIRESKRKFLRRCRPVALTCVSHPIPNLLASVLLTKLYWQKFAVFIIMKMTHGSPIAIDMKFDFACDVLAVDRKSMARNGFQKCVAELGHT